MFPDNLLFIKMHSLGNSIIILPMDTVEPDLWDHPQKWCDGMRSLADTRYGVGADQIMVVHRQKCLIFNHDGSLALACGNGTRCVVAYGMPLDGQQYVLEGPVGPLYGWRDGDMVWVNQGAARWQPAPQRQTWLETVLPMSSPPTTVPVWEKSPQRSYASCEGGHLDVALGASCRSLMGVKSSSVVQKASQDAVFQNLKDDNTSVPRGSFGGCSCFLVCKGSTSIDKTSGGDSVPVGGPLFNHSSYCGIHEGGLHGSYLIESDVCPRGSSGLPSVTDQPCPVRQPLWGWFVDMGNLHIVIGAQPPEDVPHDVWSSHPDFPDGINISFVWYEPASALWHGITYERGVGPTLGCASGACAMAVVIWGGLIPMVADQARHGVCQPNHCTTHLLDVYSQAAEAIKDSSCQAPVWPVASQKIMNKKTEGDGFIGMSMTSTSSQACFSHICPSHGAHFDSSLWQNDNSLLPPQVGLDGLSMCSRTMQQPLAIPPSSTVIPVSWSEDLDVQIALPGGVIRVRYEKGCLVHGAPVHTIARGRWHPPL